MDDIFNMGSDQDGEGGEGQLGWGAGNLVKFSLQLNLFLRKILRKKNV